MAKLDPKILERNEESARHVAHDLDYPEVAERLGCDSKTVANVIRNHYPHLRRDPRRDADIRSDRKRGMKTTELCEKYGLSKSVIWGICRDGG